MTRLYKNDSSSTLTVELAADAGTMSMTVADTSAFPLTAAPDSFFLWLSNGGAAFEIVLVTGNAATPGAGSMTVTRGRDGTAPQVWPIGTLAERVVVAQEYGEFVSEADALVNLQGDLTVEGTTTFNGPVTLGLELNVPSGGTGAETLTQNAIIVGQGVGPVAFLVPDVAGDLLQAEAGAWAKKTTAQVITKAVVDTALTAVPLGVAQGGSGAQALAAGELVVANGTGAFTTTPITTVNPLSTTKFQRRTQIFNTPGSFNYTPQAGAYVVCFIKGAGGGGGGGIKDTFNNFIYYGGDGGNGGFSYWSFPMPTAYELTITVGSGGSGGTSAEPGLDTSGANGSLSGVYGDAVSVTAAGGSGGVRAVYPSNGANGAAGTGVKTFTSLPDAGLTVPPIARVAADIENATTGGGAAGGSGSLAELDHTFTFADWLLSNGAAGSPGSVVLWEYY
jgi:hypothetical protein